MELFMGQKLVKETWWQMIAKEKDGPYSMRSSRFDLRT